MTLAAVASGGMGNPDFGHGPRPGMAGNTVLPQLQAVGHRWRRTAQKRLAQPRGVDRLPLCFNKQRLGFNRGMALVAQDVSPGGA